MVNSCCVFGCSKSAKSNENIRLYRFPKINSRFSEEFQKILANRRKAWIASLNRKCINDLQLNAMRICGAHFISGEPSDFRDTTNPDWIPTVKMGYKRNEISPSKKERRFIRKINRENAKRRKLEMEEASSHSDLVNMSQSMNDELMAFNSGTAVQTDITTSLFKAMEEELINRNEEIYKLREKVASLTWANLDCLNDKKKCIFFTGLPSVEVVKLILNQCEAALHDIRVPGLNNFQKLLLSLMKLRLNSSFRALAYRFSIQEKQAGYCFKQVVIILEYTLHYCVHWPDRDCLKKVMPACFQKSFDNKVTVIIDCFEVKSQRSSNVKAKVKTFSNYKHYYTVKYLIGITPQGYISFVSEGWGGRTSDRIITQESGFLENLLPGDIVLAARGFTVNELVSLKYAELKTPQFLRGLTQLHPVDIEQTRKIANVRIHVERVIANIRNKFKIMNGPILLEFLKYKYEDNVFMDYIVRLCCILCNLCDSVIPLNHPTRINKNESIMKELS